jgi:phosphoglycerate dehydrogenase-like enzyme
MNFTNMAKLKIWINPITNDALSAMLASRLVDHELVQSPMDADVAYGRTVPADLTGCSKLKWIHVDAAGYEAFDQPEVRKWLIENQVIVTNSSSVYAEPCAQHLLAMILAVSRDLPASFENQKHDRAWPMLPIRARSTLLKGTRVLMLGCGAIARRLAEMLAPFEPELVALRRSGGSVSGIKCIVETELDSFLPWADHIVNVLPSAPSTVGFVNSARLALMRRDAVYYSIGRGVTTDQQALASALLSGTPGKAFLDVTDPEPLPRENSLWSLQNCYITPHTAGGHVQEPERLIAHFMRNLEAFISSGSISDRVI